MRFPARRRLLDGGLDVEKKWGEGAGGGGGKWSGEVWGDERGKLTWTRLEEGLT